MNRKRIFTLVGLAFTMFLVFGTPGIGAFYFDPGGGSPVYADVTVKFQKLRCVADTDAVSGSGLAAGGADIWLKTAGSGLQTFTRTPTLLDEIDGVPNNSGIIIGPYDSREVNLNGWGSYFQVTYSDVLLDSDRTIDLYVYDQDWLGFRQTLIKCDLTIKSVGSVISPKVYHDIFAEYTHDYVNSYIDFGRVGGAYYSTYVPYPGGSTTWTMNNGLYIDVSIVYHY